MKRTLFPLLTLLVIVILAAVSHAAIIYSGGVADANTPAGSDPNNWTANTDAYIGCTSAGGDGEIDVTPTSTLLSDETLIGCEAGVTGAVTINGSGAFWTNSDYIYVGDAGIGTLDILNGGVVNSGSSVYAGKQAGSAGTILIDAGSVDTGSGGMLAAGDYGTGNLTIQNGSIATGYKGRVAYHSGSSGSTAVVSNSTWTTTDDFMVGAYGTGKLTIEAGGQVTNGDYAIIGYTGDDLSGGSTVTVTGSGSQWNNSHYITVGRAEDGTLNIEDGGLVTAVTGVKIGDYDSVCEGVVNVTGSGSELDIAGYLNVGDGGPATLNISAGGKVTVDGTLSMNVGDAAVDTYINMSDYGVLAVLLDGDPLALSSMITGDLNELRWWNDSISDWDSINNATAGVDYTLVENSGYAVLTVGAVPEPTTLMLLVSLLSVFVIPVFRRK